MAAACKLFFATLVFLLFCGFTVAASPSSSDCVHHHHRKLGHHHHHHPTCHRHGGHKVCRVGDSAGWTTREGTNFTAWANSKTFHVGDTLVFDYDERYHNVLVVDLEAYRSCNNSSPIATRTSGHDSITLKRAGHYFFIDGVSHQCKNGQKFNIRVQEPSSPSKSSHTSGATSSGAYRGVVALAVTVALLLVL